MWLCSSILCSLFLFFIPSFTQPYVCQAKNFMVSEVKMKSFGSALHSSSVGCPWIVFSFADGETENYFSFCFGIALSHRLKEHSTVQIQGYNINFSSVLCSFSLWLWPPPNKHVPIIKYVIIAGDAAVPRTQMSPNENKCQLCVSHSTFLEVCLE